MIRYRGNLKEQNVNLDFIDVVKNNFGLEIIEEEIELSFERQKAEEILQFKIKQIAKKVLEKKNYDIFFKYYFQHWTQELIADFYDISQVAIHKRLKKSKEILIQELKPWRFLL